LILKILVVDDEPDYCEVLRMILLEEQYRVTTCSNGKEALKILEKDDYDLVVTDLMMPDMNGDELLHEIKKTKPSTEVIIMTAYGTIEKAVATMKEGAYTYITKGSAPEELIFEIKRLSNTKQMQIENALLRKQTYGKGYMLESKDSAFAKVLALAERAAASDSNILIFGESGSGKEVLATYIHNYSKRKAKNFLELNCQALSESILESELFGHERGAFTGAMQKRIGLFEGAQNGTLFLDEIGGITPNLQGKLLKTIENKQIYRLGNNTPIDVDFRLISATNRNLYNDMKDGQFRSDLFYRISTIVLEIPPLRERKEDIPLFIDYFMEKYQNESNKRITSMSKGVENFLLSYTYPGNVRELKNIIERLVVLSENGYVGEDCLPPEVQGSIPGQPSELRINPSRSNDMISEPSLRDLRKELEKEYIERLLGRYPQDLDRVAVILDITRRQLFNKLVEYDLK
jgi:DNA-binding NtrC family response regulator